MTKRNWVSWEHRLSKKAQPSTTTAAEIPSAPRRPAPPSQSSEVARVVGKQNFFTRQGLRRGTRHATAG